MRYLYIIVLCSSIAMAEGLQGYFGVATGYMKVQDNFENHSNNHTIYSLDTKPKVYDRYMAFPSMDLNYNGVFVKTEFKDGSGVKAGYAWGEDSSIYVMKDGFGIEQSFEDSFSISLSQSKDEMYINPYIANGYRATKEATTTSAELKMPILEFLEFEYSYEKLSLDDQVNSDAKQSGVKHELSSMAYVIPFSDYAYGGIGVITGNGDFDGDSNDYTKLGYKYRMQMELGKHQIQLELSSSSYDFDTVNSYFSKIRDEKEEAYMLMYNKEDLFGSQSMFLNAMFIKQSVDSNIDFFDKENNIVFFNLGWKL